MPSIVRKLLIVAAVDGLLLHPSGHKSQQIPSIKITYGKNDITVVKESSPTDDKSSTSIDSFGVVGKFHVA